MKAVIFDMDGVLFDTETLCRDSWMAVAEEKGLPGMADIFPQCIGLNANDSKQIVLRAYGQDFAYEEFRQQASVWFWDYIEQNGLPIMPGTREILEWLTAHNWKVGLASSTRRSSVESHLEQAGLRSFFQTVVTGDMVEHSKPRPDIYLLACKELGVAPEDAFAIEDSPNGIRSASAAKMTPIMVPDMIAPDEEMKLLCSRIFDNLFEVLEYFKALNVESK